MSILKSGGSPPFSLSPGPRGSFWQVPHVGGGGSIDPPIWGGGTLGEPSCWLPPTQRIIVFCLVLLTYMTSGLYSRCYLLHGTHEHEQFRSLQQQQLLLFSCEAKNLQERSGTDALDSEHEKRRIKRRWIFWIEAKKNEYIRTSTIEETKKKLIFVTKLSKERRHTGVFVPQPSKEWRKTNFFP